MRVQLLDGQVSIVDGSGSGPGPAPLAVDLGGVNGAGLVLERAVADYAAGVAALSRPDGSPKFSPAEQAERERLLAEPVRRALASAEQVAKVATEQAAAELLRARAGSPVGLLSDSELASAALKRDFVGDDVAALGLDALAERLRAVGASGDRPLAWLYEQAARRRIDVMRRAAFNGGPALPAGGGFGECMLAVDALAAGLVPADRLRRVASAETVKQAADRLREDAWRAGRELASPGADPLGDSVRNMIKQIL